MLSPKPPAVRRGEGAGLHKAGISQVAGCLRRVRKTLSALALPSILILDYTFAAASSSLPNSRKLHALLLRPNDISGPRVAARHFPGVGIAGEEAFRKRNDLRALLLRAGETLLHPPEVVVKVPAPGFKLTMGDAHGASVPAASPPSMMVIWELREAGIEWRKRVP